MNIKTYSIQNATEEYITVRDVNFNSAKLLHFNRCTPMPSAVWSQEHTVLYRLLLHVFISHPSNTNISTYSFLVLRKVISNLLANSLKDLSQYYGLTHWDDRALQKTLFQTFPNMMCLICQVCTINKVKI